MESDHDCKKPWYDDAHPLICQYPPLNSMSVNNNTSSTTLPASSLGGGRRGEEKNNITTIKVGKGGKIGDRNTIT